MPSCSPRTLCSGVHVVEAPQRFYGLEVGARMTVLELEGGLLVHSPLGVEPTSLRHLGQPRWVLAPNLFHHLYVGTWAAAGLETWGAKGLAEKRPDVRFHGIVEPGMRPFGDEVELLPLTCFPLSNEVVVLHRPSRTLIVSDLVFHFAPSAPWLTRAAMWCLRGYPGCRTTVLERVAMQRAAARRELEVIADWTFDRVVMAHGEILERRAKDQLLGAFHWLSAPLAGRVAE